MPVTYPLAWPVGADGKRMAPTQIALALAQTTRSGGQAATGAEQVVASPAARWEAKLTLSTLGGLADVLTFRGFLAAMGGRAGTVLMPAFEAGRQPWPVDRFGYPIHPGRARLPRLARTIFAVDPAKDAEADILVSVLAAASVNATTLVLKVTQAGPVWPGHRFSLLGRLHEIVSTDQPEPNVLNVTVRPWLRAAIPAGTPAEFRDPLCLMRFRTDGEGALDLEGGRTARPELNLVEAF